MLSVTLEAVNEWLCVQPSLWFLTGIRNCFVSYFMLTAVAVSLLQAEREKEVRLDLKEMMTFVDV